jgi:phage/plasmid primase-like uncharacterized protein
MTFTILDKQLRDLVVKIVHDSAHAHPENIQYLLERGANPKAEIKEDEFSAYDLITQYNEDGKLNAYKEVFDQYTELVNRKADSDWEGMHS